MTRLSVRTTLRATAVRLLPAPVLAAVRRHFRRFRRIDFGSFKRTQPISMEFGYDRGTPIDRIYIEHFLNQQKEHIHGRALEVVDNLYTARFGAGRVAISDVIDLDPGNPAATIVSDLAVLGVTHSDTFDCIILTQVLHLIYDMPRAIRSLRLALKPGGTLLVTVPGISPIDRGKDAGSWYWSLNKLSAERLFRDHFQGSVQVMVYGNIFAAVCFLHGLAAEEVPEDMLEPPDQSIPVTIGIVAKRDQ